MRKALLKESKGKYKITATVSKNKNLKNGDKVTVKVKYPESYLKSKKIKLTNTEFEVTVKGLSVDPLDFFSEEAAATLSEDNAFESGAVETKPNAK